MWKRTMTLELEKQYRRCKDIHEKFGGQKQGEIATPAKDPTYFSSQVNG